GQVDTSGALQMSSSSGDIIIERPSREWGRARKDHTDDPVVGELQQKLDLLLVNVRRHAYVDVIRDTANGSQALANYAQVLRETLNPPRTPLLGDEDQPRTTAFGGPPSDSGPFPLRFITDPKTLEAVEGYEGREWKITQTRGGQTWVFIIRAYKKEK